jgi:hypothetical protein
MATGGKCRFRPSLAPPLLPSIYRPTSDVQHKAKTKEMMALSSHPVHQLGTYRQRATHSARATAVAALGCPPQRAVTTAVAAAAVPGTVKFDIREQLRDALEGAGRSARPTEVLRLWRPCLNGNAHCFHQEQEIQGK